MNVTLPPPSPDATVAVNVTCWLVSDGFADDVMVVVVPVRLPTAWLRMGDVDGENVAAMAKPL